MDNLEFYRLLNELNIRDKERKYDMTPECKVKECPYFNQIDFKNCAVNKQNKCAIKQRGKLN